MKIFEKEINFKDYDCSFNKNFFEKRYPLIGLYIQVENKCNANCDFCNPGKINNSFNLLKLDNILKELTDKNLLSKISLTGGEPTINLKKLNNIINLCKNYSIPINLNTNGYNLNILKKIYNDFSNIYISKHHYNNNINNDLMNLKTPDIEEIGKIDKDNKIYINCVLQKDYIDSYEEIINFLEYLGTTNINKIRFISLYPLTKKAIEKMINIDKIIAKCNKFTNSGILFDKNICSCLEFLYVTKTGKVIIVQIKHNKTNKMPCCRQLVFNGEYLYDGFEKKNKIF